jgi:ferric-dicitrate binding protein FerR (iron transport regulator)
VFNRYNDTKIVVASPALQQQALVGYFYLNDPAGFVAALETSFDARVRRSGERIVVD